MKFLLLIIVLMLVMLFLPNYELYIVEDAFSDQFEKVDSFLVQEEKCQAARKQYINVKSYCKKTTMWGSYKQTTIAYQAERVIE